MFTAATGLQLHMDDVHGSGAKPYDCHLCVAKFFFRAELEHHLNDHETGKVQLLAQQKFIESTRNSSPAADNMDEDHDHLSEENDTERSRSPMADDEADVKHQSHPDDDEEYIEVEKLADASTVEPANQPDASSGESEPENSSTKDEDANDSDRSNH